VPWPFRIQEMAMRKELQTAAALAALLAAPALAQNTPPTVPNAGQQIAPGPAPQAGSTAMPASPTTQPSATSPGPASSTAAAPAADASGGLGFIDAQQDEERLASTLIGTPVYNAANESLGEINDVLLAADGRLKAVVVGVGGFLGIAERDVAVPWAALEASRDEDQDLQLRLEISREQLEQAPPFETVAERRAAEQAARATQNPPAAGLGTPGAGTGAGGAVAPAPVPGATPPAPAQ
jgi:sporulation protein YlmC with PRC-barrel domain